MKRVAESVTLTVTQNVSERRAEPLESQKTAGICRIRVPRKTQTQRRTIKVQIIYQRAEFKIVRSMLYSVRR